MFGNLPLVEAVKIDQVKAAVATGTTAINSNEVDMEGYDGVLFIASFGSTATDISLKAQQDTVTGMGGAADLEGSSKALDATAKIIFLDIFRPLERFVRVVATRTTTTTIEAIWAIRYKARNPPVANASSAQLVKQLVSPAEGTA